MKRVVHRRLTEEEFEALFGDPMENVTETADASLDIWAYVDSIDGEDLGDLTAHDVSAVYRHPNGRIEHVIVDTCAENIHLILVIDREAKAIVGHHILDLRKKYGLPSN